MSLITKPNTFAAGAVIQASEHNANFDTIYNDHNGNITNANISATASIDASKLNLSTIAQAMSMTSQPINFAKGTDVASAATTDIGAVTGNFIDITGTTTITSLGTSQAGTFRMVRFMGILTLTHNATSLILPTADSIVTAVNDTAGFVSLGSGDWKCVFYERYNGSPLSATTPSNALSGSVIQTVIQSSVAYANLGSTSFPQDDSFPENGEGNAIAALDKAITPNNASNFLLIEAGLELSSSGATAITQVALFQDATTNALCICGGYTNDADIRTVRLMFYMTAGTISSTTFKLRVGNRSGNTIYINGTANAAARQYGGACFSFLKIQEIKA